MNKSITFTKGKKKREELRLPILHYIVADDWIDKLGHNAFVAWLKFVTWCDRSDQRKDESNDVIPYSLQKVAKKLGVSAPTLRNTIIKPLWNYGLIDLKEYEDSKIKGTKPINIIVYDYPQNDKSLETKPLEKIRNYDTDYSSESKTFGEIGAEKKRRKAQEKEREKEREKEKENECLGGKIIFREGVKNILGGRVKNFFPINVSNSINNDSNIYNNDSNNLYLYPKKKYINKEGDKNDINKNDMGMDKKYNSGMKSIKKTRNPYQELSDYIYNCKLPNQLKKFFETQIEDLIDYPTFDITVIEYVYNTYINYIDPDCSKFDYLKLNDVEFTNSMKSMYEAMAEDKKVIANMEGLVKKWVLQGIEFKKENNENKEKEDQEWKSKNNNQEKGDKQSSYTTDYSMYDFTKKSYEDGKLPF